MIETWPAIWQTASKPRANTGSTSAGRVTSPRMILGACRHVLAPAVELVVDHRDGVPVGKQAPAQVRADKPGPARHEYSHPSHPSRPRTHRPAQIRSPSDEAEWLRTR